MITTPVAIARPLEAFFTERLLRDRQASPHTIAAYRDTFLLLLAFAQARLRKAPAALVLKDLDAPFIGLLIRSSGYYNHKAAKLKALCAHVGNHWPGNLEVFLEQDLHLLRSELMQLRGIGPETADSIALYAAEKPSFVVDVYTHRVFCRHGWVPEQLSYDDLRGFFMDCLPRDVSLFKEYHALIGTGRTPSLPPPTWLYRLSP